MAAGGAGTADVGDPRGLAAPTTAGDEHADHDQCRDRRQRARARAEAVASCHGIGGSHRGRLLRFGVGRHRRQRNSEAVVTPRLRHQLPRCNPTPVILSGVRVLIVEDHRDLAITIADGLRREGMAVDVAFDGQEGLRHGIQDSLRRRRARPRPARAARRRGLPRTRRLRGARSRADADRRRHDREPRRRPQPRRRRLPAEAVRVRRARRADPRARPPRPAGAFAGARLRRDPARHDPPRRDPRRPPPRPEPEGADRARAAARRRRPAARPPRSCSSAAGTSTPTRSAASSRSRSIACDASSATPTRSRPFRAPATASAHEATPPDPAPDRALALAAAAHDPRAPHRRLRRPVPRLRRRRCSRSTTRSSPDRLTSDYFAKISFNAGKEQVFIEHHGGLSRNRHGDGARRRRLARHDCRNDQPPRLAAAARPRSTAKRLPKGVTAAVTNGPAGRRDRVIERRARHAADRVGHRARDHGAPRRRARLGHRRPRAAPAARDHGHRAGDLSQQPPPAPRPHRPRRRAAPTRTHLRRAARAARDRVHRPAPVRRQRLARTAHAAHLRAHADRGRARRPQREQRAAPRRARPAARLRRAPGAADRSTARALTQSTRPRPPRTGRPRRGHRARTRSASRPTG